MKTKAKGAQRIRALRTPQPPEPISGPNRTITLPFLDPWTEAGHDLMVLTARPDLETASPRMIERTAYFEVLLA